MKRLWGPTVLAVIVFALGVPPGIAGQKRRATATSREGRAPQLGSVEQFKEAFRAGADRVRLVALISPT